jgi:hypothetical protein
MAPEALRGTPSGAKAEVGPHSLAMLLARSRIETIPTTASPSITGRCRKASEEHLIQCLGYRGLGPDRHRISGYPLGDR